MLLLFTDQRKTDGLIVPFFFTGSLITILFEHHAASIEIVQLNMICIGGLMVVSHFVFQKIRAAATLLLILYTAALLNSGPSTQELVLDHGFLLLFLSNTMLAYIIIRMWNVSTEMIILVIFLFFIINSMQFIGASEEMIKAGQEHYSNWLYYTIYVSALLVMNILFITYSFKRIRNGIRAN